jgi:hypothetical protein
MTLPAGLVLRLAGDLLAARLAQLRRRLDRNPRRPAESATAGRRIAIENMDRELRRIGAMRARGEVSAEIAGLLLAMAGGHSDAIITLEEIDPRIVDLRAEDVARACEILLGAK